MVYILPKNLSHLDLCNYDLLLLSCLLWWFSFSCLPKYKSKWHPPRSRSCAETNIQHATNYDCKLRILRTRGEKKIGEKIDIFFKLMFVADIIVSILESTCLFYLSGEKW